MRAVAIGLLAAGLAPLAVAGWAIDAIRWVFLAPAGARPGRARSALRAG